MINKKTPFALIVEDDEVQAKILMSVLKDFDIHSEVSHCSQVYLRRIKEVKPDLCFIDLHLEIPNSGFTLIEATRKLLGQETKIIVISSVSEKEAISRAIETGANDFIIKPINREILAAKTSQFITTEKLLNNQIPLKSLPNGGSEATIHFDLSVKSIDEFGLTLTGNHLLSKGTAFYFEGRTITELSHSLKPLLLMVVSTWVENDGHSYGARADFDHTDRNLMTHVRHWISSHS